MKIRRLIPVTPVVLVFLIGIGVPSWAGAVLPPPPDKTLVTDGHVYHDTGNLWNNVTNFGLIGSWPETSASFSGAPSARWPGETGVDQLFAASLWVGALVDGQPRVTTGAYSFEMRATDAPEDTIYTTAMGAVGGSRYPAPMADDDGDGLEDEDPLNGLDDDGDGLVDEDFAAIGDQEFRCVYSDTAAHIRDTYPDHQPLGISVVQRSFQWDEPGAENFIGYDFTVTNVGTFDLDNIYLGLFADFDIGTGPGSPENDLAGLWQGDVVTSGGTVVPVSLAYTHDDSGYAGFVFCGMTGQDECAGGYDPAIHGFQIFDGNTSFDSGGDPTNDAERWIALSDPGIDPDTNPLKAADVRTLISNGPFASLPVGESLSYRVAMVAAADMAGLEAAAGQAVLIAHGSCFDRDGDPANGDEFHVPWLSPEDTPVAAAAGYLEAAVSGSRTTITITTSGADAADLALVRHPSADLPARNWPDRDWTPLGQGTEGLRFAVVDDDPGPWPRTYDLVRKSAGQDDLVLYSLTQGDTPAARTSLEAGPNPFNPSLTVSFSLAEEGPVNIAMFDARGRLVRVLLNGRHEAGTDRLTWDGRDQAGRQAPSGVYLLRLTTDKQVVNRRVTMIR